MGPVRGDDYQVKKWTILPRGKISLQTGDYLGEDDIERFEDVYARGAEA